MLLKEIITSNRFGGIINILLNLLHWYTVGAAVAMGYCKVNIALIVII